MKENEFASLLAAINRIDETSVQDMPPADRERENFWLKKDLRAKNARIRGLEKDLRAERHRNRRLKYRIAQLEEENVTRPIRFVPPRRPTLRDVFDKGAKGQH